jgi:hypothetical protein
VGIAQGVYTPRQDLNATNRANTLPLIDRYGREQFAIGISVEPIIDVLHAELHFH